ncbi:Ribosomal protein L31, mitochondrial [Phaffia rhodozyma]|uniref:Ribosomal protein L31, mitochondrial n=1 Tax=Phaffia rhodozyma TaxID=264483 RepID=A0A0F7SKA3_PHARH|nr:Ribosomal protein L31, mitochondrial [Phaffia rhodozyma]
MFPSLARLGGLVHKVNAKMSPCQKAGQRKRLKTVDEVIEAVRASGVKLKLLDNCLALPKESEMRAIDKYTTFSRTWPGYRKPLNRVPKFTRLTHRVNPVGY